MNKKTLKSRVPRKLAGRETNRRRLERLLRQMLLAAEASKDRTPSTRWVE